MSGFTLRRLWNIVRYWTGRHGPCKEVSWDSATYRETIWELKADGLWHATSTHECPADECPFAILTTGPADQTNVKVTYGDI